MTPIELERRLQYLEREASTLANIANISTTRIEWLLLEAAKHASTEAMDELELRELRAITAAADTANPRDAAIAQRTLSALGLTAPDFIPAEFESQ